MKINWHRIFGIIVLALVTLRLVDAWHDPTTTPETLFALGGILLLILAVEVYAYVTNMW